MNVDARDDQPVMLGWALPDPPRDDRGDPDPEGAIARGLGVRDTRERGRVPAPAGQEANDTPDRDRG